MSITPIANALTGERVVALSPANAIEAALDWARRPNLYPGRTLTAATLEQRQRWQAGHIAQRGQAFTAGVVRGMEVGFAVDGIDPAGRAIVTLKIGAGQGLAANGEDVVLTRPVECRLATLPVVAQPSVFAGLLDPEAQQALEQAAAQNADPTTTGALLPRAIGVTLGKVIAADPARLPPVGILVLQPVTVNTSNFDPNNPCDRCPCDDGTSGTDPASFEDWRIADGVRLLWYAWPQESLALPTSSRLRNELAHLIFNWEGSSRHGTTLPWEYWGVPIALFGVDAQWRPLFADRAAVVRQGGRARDPRLQLLSPGTASLASNSRLPGLWQARIEQFAEQVAAAGEPAPAARVLAQDFLHLPPCGLLPTNALELLNLGTETQSMRSEFFPLGFEIDAAPVPVDQLDLALRASAGMAPINLSNPESVRVLVPVPQAAWEPRLLLREAVAPEFQQTVDQFLAVRARVLGARQGLRVKQSVLIHAINGTTLEVPAFNNDAEALEIETLTAWGLPPDGGGHRSQLRPDFHQHYFQNALQPLAVLTEGQLYCWVYLDPENPPSTVMFQWRTDGWEHRAYWGDNLIELGTNNTPSRQRIGDLPAAGKWLRLEVPVASVGLSTASSVDGMAFVLFGGRAVFAETGAVRDGVDLPWFGHVLPQGAQLAGEDPWELLTHNDLWAPFEPALSVTPPLPASIPNGGGHIEPPGNGWRQHVFDSAAAPFTPRAGENLFCWVYLDPNNPPRQVMVQWHTTNWEHRAYWGANLIEWGVNGTESRRRVGDLPVPGGWVRLQVPATAVGVLDQAVDGMAFTLFDGCAVFGATGALLTINNADERTWFSNVLPAGARTFGIWRFLAQRDLHVPTPASNVGHVDVISDLFSDPSLAGLSGQERSQLSQLGLDGFIAYLKSRADRADDIVDYGFVKVQTDVYRIRQLMLGATAATRLAVSPALASIAQAETAVASQTQIESFFNTLKTAAPAPSGIPAPAAAAQSASSLSAVARFDGNTRIERVGGFSDFAVNLTTSPKLIETKTNISPFLKQPGITPTEVVNIAPLVGTTFIRTTSITERLKDPKSKEARDYSTASRVEAVEALLRLADTLIAEDSGVVPGLFSGIDLHGVNGDPFLGANNTTRKRAFADFLNVSLRTNLLADLARVPPRGINDADEAAHFSDSTDLSDHTVALMRQMEARIKRYRDAIAVCQGVLDGLKKDTNALQMRLNVVGTDLAEARHDVSVARALLAEETDRINGINQRRATVLNEQVRFLAFVRPRAMDNLLTAPRRDLDPGLLEPAVPACLKEHADIPDELTDMLRVVREAPAYWFVTAPKLVDKLDRPDILIKALQSTRDRIQIKTAPAARTMVAQSKVATAITRVTARQADLLSARIDSVQRLDIAALAGATWQSVRQQAAQVVSFGDLIDGAHGRNQVAREAAAEFDRIAHIAACLHAEFSSVLPSIRLDWAETLSEFDVAPNLRNLASLARWAEIPYIDRHQMQAYVDWLFAQLDHRQVQSEALINDVIRMCLLLASHAPVDRIIAGRLKQPVTGVRPGTRLPLTVFDASRLRVGMQALMIRAGNVVARATVEDIGAAEVSGRVIHTNTTQLDLGDDVRVQFSDAAAVSLTSVKTFAAKTVAR